MLSSYPACFFKEEHGYSIIFPDLNVATCGETLDEAFLMAYDCLAGYLSWLQEDGEPAPAPSAADKINPADIAEDLETELGEAFVSMIIVDVAEYSRTLFEKTIRIPLTIPTWLHHAALEQEINLSQVLQEALTAKIQEHPNAETIAAMEEAERISRDPNVKGYTDIDEMMKELLA